MPPVSGVVAISPAPAASLPSAERIPKDNPLAIETVGDFESARERTIDEHRENTARVLGLVVIGLFASVVGVWALTMCAMLVLTLVEVIWGDGDAEVLLAVVDHGMEWATKIAALLSGGLGFVLGYYFREKRDS